MLTLMLGMAAASMSAPAFTLPQPILTTAATSYTQRRSRRYAYREWRGRDGRRYCRRPDGTTGLVVGAAAGALVGRSIDRHGDRTGGTLLGAVAGGLLGREVERGNRRCR